ncbi:hypothetical protein SIM22_03690 [Bacillus cereus group sp. BfR-BA-01363]|uniref:hypothetical protein n=1 Tax=Bacillus cereus group sp. BfR-BA-01363 TaxID=3094882 RepID=UPI0029C4EC0A|nr:hypothetical protein [Bacillus cereus group sp. BfR-BA-01363]MDX5853228.1 hypothetical protein [Bacillus cereus group sp. BfR-BA-01363]
MKEWFLKLFNRRPKGTSTYLKYEDGEVIPLETTNKSKLKDDLIEDEKQSNTTFKTDAPPKKSSYTANSPVNNPNRKKRLSKIIMLLFLIVLFASFCQLFYYFLSKNTSVINGNNKIDSITKKVEESKNGEISKKKENDDAKNEIIIPNNEPSEKTKEKEEEKPIFSFDKKDIKVKSMNDERKSLLSLSTDLHNFILDSLLSLKSEVVFYDKGKSNKYIFMKETDLLEKRISNAKKSLESKEKELSNEEMTTIYENLLNRLVALDELVKTVKTIERETIIETTNEYIEKENDASVSYQSEFVKILTSYGVTYKTVEGKITYSL